MKKIKIESKDEISLFDIIEFSFDNGFNKGKETVIVTDIGKKDFTGFVIALDDKADEIENKSYLGKGYLSVFSLDNDTFSRFYKIGSLPLSDIFSLAMPQLISYLKENNQESIF